MSKRSFFVLKCILPVPLPVKLFEDALYTPLQCSNSLILTVIFTVGQQTMEMAEKDTKYVCYCYTTYVMFLFVFEVQHRTLNITIYAKLPTVGWWCWRTKTIKIQEIHIGFSMCLEEKWRIFWKSFLTIAGLIYFLECTSMA